jgi:DNA-binding LacI/PurR family transcriptional regulator
MAYEDQVMGHYIDIILTHPGFEDYDLVIHSRKESSDKPLKPSDFKSDLLDGMIYLTPSEEHDEFLNVASKNFPIVLLGQVSKAEEKIPCIDINNRKMGQQAVEHLVGLGRKNILMLLPEKLQHLACIQDRLSGYRDALSNNGIPIAEDLICSVRCLKESVSEFFSNRSDLGNIDAIFCASDDLAVQCIEPLKTMGYRIPEDIALIGFDDMAIAQHTTPMLSSVRRPSEKQVFAAIDLLLKILKKEVPYEPGFHEVETDLVIRESTVASGH